MDADRIRTFVEQRWDDSILPELEAYIRIPNKSPHFDPEWAEKGHMEEATEHIRRWCAEQDIAGMSLEVVRLEGRTPVLYMEIPAFGGGNDERTVLLYGHLDKQPEFAGWDEGKGPWIPVREGDKLYGRGGADDGYAAYASLTAIAALQREGIAHDRCVVLIEACEESGSYDLPPYLDHLEERMGKIDLVICLDSGAGNYDQLWSTTSLRGLVAGVVTVEVMEPMSDGSPSGVHSGIAGGVVPSSFRVLRTLLDRIEDAETGAIRLDALKVPIPAARKQQAEAAAQVLGGEEMAQFRLTGEPSAEGAAAQLAMSWEPQLEVVGSDLPDLSGGNVLRGRTRAKLSIRIPPHVDPDAATEEVARVLTSDPPYGARVSFEPEQGAPGWEAPPLAPWLEESLHAASHAFFGAQAVWMGLGGTIPFMGMLGEKFPEAQFVITGVLGPESNAHGPNEFLHVPCGTKLTACMAKVLADHSAR